MRLRWSAGALAALALAIMAPGASAQVTVARQAGKLKGFTVATPKGALRVTGRPWTNTVLTTESGKAIHLADPLLGRLRLRGEQRQRQTASWGDAKFFETARLEEVQDPSRPGALILRLTLENADVGLRKDLALLIEPGQDVVYVTSRVLALKDAEVLDDEVSMWMAPAAQFSFIVDGRQVEPADKRREEIKRWAAALRRDETTGFGVIILPEAPAAAANCAASAGFRLDEKVKAGWFQLARLPRGPMKAGETRLLRYALFWGDGLKPGRVAELARQAETGGLDDKPWTLPQP